VTKISNYFFLLFLLSPTDTYSEVYDNHYLALPILFDSDDLVLTNASQYWKVEFDTDNQVFIIQRERGRERERDLISY
jgi:hypothetical protein